MASDRPVFAGVEVSSGRKPVTVAVVDDGLEILTLKTTDLANQVTLLREHEQVSLAFVVPTSRAGKELYPELRKKLGQAGFKPFTKGDGELLWCETRAEDCFHAFQSNLLPRRTLEGRIQRALILYEAGLRCNDPMDYYEEITRYKLLQGILPAENIYTLKQLDALAAAYVAWMADNRPGQVVTRGELILPKVFASEKEDAEQLTYL